MSGKARSRAAEAAADSREALTAALGHFRAGRLHEAERLCRGVLEARPDDADALHLLGVIARRAGHPAAAADLIGRALAARPDDARAHHGLAGALADQGRLDEAAAAYARAVEIDPALADAHAGLGAVRRRQGRSAEAEAAFRRAVALTPDAPTPHLRLGNALADQDKLAEAEAAYRRAIELRPGFVEAHVALGNVLLDQQRLDDAVAAYQRAVALAPDRAEVHNNLGNALKGRRSHDDAVAAYRRALDLDPRLAETRFNLANTLQEMGRDDEAAAAYRAAMELAPDYAKPHHGLANLELARGDAKAALAACDACLARDPGNRHALAIKAAALDALGERDAVRTLIDLDRLIRPTRIAAPEGYADLAAFNAALARHALDHPTLAYEPLNKATRGGRQTRELLVEPKGPVADLERAIRAAVADYMAALPAEPGHPFLAHPPARWRLNVWATILGAQGHQAPHIHPSGWLSGVYYVQVPAAVGDDGDAGWIEFGGHDPAYRLAVAPELRLVRPEEGLMLLFPSYVYHRTVPFESDELRISIAFDVLPVG